VHRKIAPGTEVITTGGRRAVVVKELPRAAGSIKAAWKEADFDRTPYTVRFSDGSYGFSLGGEIGA
jgi:hypothetical protein